MIKTIEILRTYGWKSSAFYRLWLLSKWLHGDEKNLVAWIVLKALLHLIAFLASGRHFGDPFVLPWGSSLPRIPVHHQDDVTVVVGIGDPCATFTFATFYWESHIPIIEMLFISSWVAFHPCWWHWTHPAPKSNLPPDFDLEKIHKKTAGCAWR